MKTTGERSNRAKGWLTKNNSWARKVSHPPLPWCFLSSGLYILHARWMDLAFQGCTWWERRWKVYKLHLYPGDTFNPFISCIICFLFSFLVCFFTSLLTVPSLCADFCEATMSHQKQSSASAYRGLNDLLQSGGLFAVIWHWTIGFPLWPHNHLENCSISYLQAQ